MTTRLLYSMAGRDFYDSQPGSLSHWDIFIKSMCLRSWMKVQIMVLLQDRQFALPIYVVGSPGGVSTNNAVSIDAAVLMIEIHQEDWVEEILDDGMVFLIYNLTI